MRRALAVVVAIAACGEEHDHGGHGHGADEATIAVVTTPSPAVAGEAAVLTVSLIDGEGGPAQGIEVSHERYLHTVVFGADLVSFAHLHQEDSEPVTPADLTAARFEMPHTFPTAGRYLVAGDWCRLGLPGHDQATLDVGGAPAMAAEDADTAREKTVDAYQVSLAFPAGEPRTGQASALELTVAGVTDLEMYLGAEMHLSAVKSGLGEALHTHPELDGAHEHCGPARAQVYRGPTIPFAVEFPSAGRWKIWAQFQRGGNVTTVGFLIDVL